MKRLNKTRSYCKKCAVFHDAFYQQEGNAVFFIVSCPQGEFRHCVSHDAALFNSIRCRARFSQQENIPYEQYKKHFHLLGITSQCNFHCNLCYAASNSEHAVEQLTPEEIFRIGRQIKKQGGYAIVLSGGEPTLHPELFTVIEGLTKIGLEVSLATNGYRISTEPGFAKQLKSAGLQQINLSFDTLKQETQKIYRNNTWVKEKIEAIESARDARLRIIAIATMSKYNIDETGELIAFLTGYAPALSVAILQPYFFSVNQRDKNELFNEAKIVKREEIIHALVHSGAIAGLSQAHFWPFPQFNLALHPDCAAIAILAVDDGAIYPLDRIVDMEQLFAQLGKYKTIRNPILAGLTLFGSVMKSARKGQKGKLLKCFLGMMRGKGKHSLFIVAVEGLMDSAYQDDERTKRCTAAVWQREGEIKHIGCICSLEV